MICKFKNTLKFISYSICIKPALVLASSVLVALGGQVLRMQAELMKNKPSQCWRTDGYNYCFLISFNKIHSFLLERTMSDIFFKFLSSKYDRASHAQSVLLVFFSCLLSLHLPSFPPSISIPLIIRLTFYRFTSFY